MAKKCLNYLGQLRCYSLVDLILLLITAKISGQQFWGSIGIWIGFLAFLESRHNHEGREQVPSWSAFLLMVAAIPFFGIEKGLLFCVLSFLYAQKNRGWWGLVSPFCRGLQTVIMVGLGPFGWVAGVLMTARNVLGDGRDTLQDRQEGLKTWTVVLGIKADWLFLHFFAVIFTTLIWWSAANLPPFWLVSALAVEAGAYWLTPRSSNCKAKAKLFGIWQGIIRLCPW